MNDISQIYLELLMNYFEAYSYLFADSLFSNLITSLYNELVIDVMIILGSYDKFLILILSSLASSIGTMMNWMLGRILRSVRKTEEILVSNIKYEKLNRNFVYYSPFIMLFSFIPTIGPILSVITGIFKVRLLSIIFFIFAGKIFYYSFKLFIV